MFVTRSFRLRDRWERILKVLGERLGTDSTSALGYVLEGKAEELERMGFLQEEPSTKPSLLQEVWAAKRADAQVRGRILEEIRRGLAEGRFDHRERGIDQVTPLEEAARGRGDAELVRLLLDAGADIDAQDYYGNTALVLAAQEQGHDDNLGVIDLLLSRGAWPFFRPSLLAGRDIFGWAEEWKKTGTQRVIQLHAQNLSLEKFLGRVSSPSSIDLVQEVAWFRIVQDWEVPRIHAELCQFIEDRPEIRHDLAYFGDISKVVAWVLQQKGAWRRMAQKMSMQGASDSDIVRALRPLGALWVDVAMVLSRLGRAPEVVLETMWPLLEDRGVGNLAHLVHGAYYHHKGSLVPVREWLDAHQVSLQDVLQARWFDAEWRDAIRQRMGLGPEELPS